MVERGGFEPPKALASRFTVCPVKPLRYLSTLRVESRNSNVEIRNESSFEIRISGFEFPRFCGIGAGDGNRTHLTSLEGWRITTMLRPHLRRTRFSSLRMRRAQRYRSHSAPSRAKAHAA